MKRTLVAWPTMSKRGRVLLTLIAICCSLAEASCGGGILSGVTSKPNVTLSTLTMSFNSQTSQFGSVNLTNSGNASLNISGITISPPFSESDACSPKVAPGASCVISVTFTPHTTGTFTGSLSISDNAAGGVQTVSLTGVGATGSATLTGRCFGIESGPSPTCQSSVFSSDPSQCPAGQAAITPGSIELCASTNFIEFDGSTVCQATDSKGNLIRGNCEAQ